MSSPRGEAVRQVGPWAIFTTIKHFASVTYISHALRRSLMSISRDSFKADPFSIGTINLGANLKSFTRGVTKGCQKVYPG